MQHRTLIVPASVLASAKGLADQFGPAAQNMWNTPCSPTGKLPATHYISAGFIGGEFAEFLPCMRVKEDSAGKAVVEITPANHAAFVALAEEKKVTTPSKAAFDSLMAAVVVSDEPPFEALDRLGLKLVQENL